MTAKEHPTATITTPNSTPGQSGRFGSERVAAFRRNQWPLHRNAHMGKAGKREYVQVLRLLEALPLRRCTVPSAMPCG